jgi:lipopolysaccharide transport system ATP-binding protein
MPVLIECEYEKRDAAEIKNFDIAISFFTQTGALMFVCRSSVRGQYFRLGESRGKLYCRVRKWPLAAGIYSYNLFSVSNGAIMDGIQDVGKIEVTAGDFYGTGKLPATPIPSVYIDYEWVSEDQAHIGECSSLDG